MSKFNQVCVWQATVVDDVEEFVAFMKNEFDVRIEYLEAITTKPDIDDSGSIIPDTGGRIDQFFKVHDDDIRAFSIKRLLPGIRWIEDVLARMNYTSPIYPKHVYKYVTWNWNAIDMPD